MNIKLTIQNISNALTPPIILTGLNKILYSHRISSAEKRMAQHSKLHIGCGTNILAGWANIDLLGGTKVIWWNCTTRLPIKTGSVNFIYNEHFIEHINMNQGKELLSECYRVLKPGGVVRLSTPNLKKIIDEYLLGDLSEWRNVKYSVNTGSQYTPCRMVNDAMRLWGHEFVYDYEELTKLLKKIGFNTIIPVLWGESKYEELKGLESRPFNDEIIIEATK